ncbi:MAG: peptide chain release factor N(5)-glutamine methyltransferase [Pseudomonadota bacterium]
MPVIKALLAHLSDLPGETARLDLELLLCAALGKPRSFLFAWPEYELTEAEHSQFKRLRAERERGVPVAYLLGEREFWSLSFTVNEHVLVPRPETELLVEVALALPLETPRNQPPSQFLRTADLGTGSGAIAIALGKERPNWSIAAVDASVDALAVAMTNADRHDVSHIEFFHGSWFEPLKEQNFSLILSNPPYIAERDPHLALGDVQFEPRTALTPGATGMEAITILAEEAPNHLLFGGFLYFEHGHDQGAQSRDLLATRGFEQVETHRDHAGLERVTGGCWRNS